MHYKVYNRLIFQNEHIRRMLCLQLFQQDAYIYRKTCTVINPSYIARTNSFIRTYNLL